jgi:ribosomal protein L37AE/L43A
VFEVSLSTFLFLATIVTFGVITGLWVYYERQDARLGERQRVRHAYKCIKCGRLYERRGQREVAPCPDCGFANDRLRF